jgi:hypothetical protein
MTGCPSANLPISRILYLASCVAGDYFADPLYILKDGLCTPKTPGTKSGQLQFVIAHFYFCFRSKKAAAMNNLIFS